MTTEVKTEDATLSALNEALSALRDAKSQNSQKGAKLKQWVLDVDQTAVPAASFVTSKNQVYNRVGEQFDRGATDVIFLVKTNDLVEPLASEIKKKAYPALRTIAIFTYAGSAFDLANLLVNRSDAVSTFLEKTFKKTYEKLVAANTDKPDVPGTISPLVVDWNAAKALPPSGEGDLIGLDSAYALAVEALRAKHVILLGAPGVGKSRLAEHICRSLHINFMSVTATAEWTTADTIGGYFPDLSDTIDFRSGLIVRSMQEQRWLIIDEINRADIDKAFGEMFSVLAGQPVRLPYLKIVGKQTLPIVIGANRDEPGVFGIQMDDQWRLIGTMNTVDKASLFRMSSAFMRRFAFINVPLPSEQEYDSLIDAQFSAEALKTELGSRALEHLKAAFSSQSDGSLRSGGLELGPAIVIDFATFIAGATENGSGSYPESLYAGYSMFVFPQLEGNDQLYPVIVDRLPRLLGTTLEQLPPDFLRDLRGWLGVPDG